MLEKIIALKEDLFSLKNKIKILALVGVLIIVLGGGIISISYLSKETGGNKNAQGEQGGATTTSTLLRPDWDPVTRDICGDGICGITEEAGKNKCSRDCSSKIPLAIDNFTATPSVVTPGKTAVLSWSSTAEFCASSGSDDAYFVTGGEPNGSVHTFPLQLNKTYTLSCMNNAGEMQTKEITVTVESPVAKPTAKKVAPTITFTATPSAITEGQSTTLFWIVANATSCIASGGASWGWIGERGTKGTQVTPALSIGEIYTLTCRGDGGSTTKNIRVTVNKKSTDGGADLVDAPTLSSGNTGLAPYVTLRTSPASIKSGETTTISWYSVDAVSCVAGGDGSSWGWKGSIPTSGAKITPPLSVNQSFAVTCTGAQGGVTTENATVEVAATTSQTGKKDCSLGGTTIKSGKFIRAYKDTTPRLGSGIVCSAELRRCENGVLSGSYTNLSCVNFSVDEKTTCGTWDGVTPVATFLGLGNCDVNSCKWYGYEQSADLYKCKAILDTTNNTWKCKSLEKVNTNTQDKQCF